MIEVEDVSCLICKKINYFKFSTKCFKPGFGKWA